MVSFTGGILQNKEWHQFYLQAAGDATNTAKKAIKKPGRVSYLPGFSIYQKK